MKRESSVRLWARKNVSQLGFLKGNAGYLMEVKPLTPCVQHTCLTPAQPFPRPSGTSRDAFAPFTPFASPSASCVIALASAFFSSHCPHLHALAVRVSKDRAGAGPTKEELTPPLGPFCTPTPCCLGGYRIKIEICPDCCVGLKSV